MYPQRLHTELVRVTGKLADPTDIAFDPERLDDVENWQKQSTNCQRGKHTSPLGVLSGKSGKGPSPTTGTVDLAAILRQRAG